MRKMVLGFCGVALSASAWALPNPVAVIRENLEVKAFIGAFEKNRSQRCEEIDFNNTVIGHKGFVTSKISCNQYDESGAPMANVHSIEIKGLLSGSFFTVDQIKVTGME